MIYVDETGSPVGSGCDAYMRYENAVRRLETRSGSIIGVDGGIDAVRRSLYVPMRPDLLPDFVLPLKVIERGFRVVFEEEALLYEQSLTRREDEWRMRVRVILRTMHALWYMRKLLDPFTAGAVSVQLILHKGLRYAVGFFQIAVLLASVALATRHAVYGALLALQALFYVAAVLGLWLPRLARRVRLMSYISYSCLLNVAALIAFWRFLKGERVTTWVPRKG
jgi:hypothetical protein